MGIVPSHSKAYDTKMITAAVKQMYGAEPVLHCEDGELSEVRGAGWLVIGAGRLQRQHRRWYPSVQGQRWWDHAPDMTACWQPALQVHVNSATTMLPLVLS